MLLSYTSSLSLLEMNRYRHGFTKYCLPPGRLSRTRLVASPGRQSCLECLTWSPGPPSFPVIVRFSAPRRPPCLLSLLSGLCLSWLFGGWLLSSLSGNLPHSLSKVVLSSSSPLPSSPRSIFFLALLVNEDELVDAIPHLLLLPSLSH